MKKKVDAEKTICEIANKKGTTVEEIRREIKLALLAGMCSHDPEVQAKWKKVPCQGSVPTPEEVIAYLATKIRLVTDPFA